MSRMPPGAMPAEKLFSGVLPCPTKFRMAPGPRPLEPTENNPGAAAVTVTFTGALGPRDVVTTTGTLPAAVDQGICALIWPGETKNSAAARPAKVTLVPPSEVISG